MAAARRTTEAGMLEKRHLDELVTDLMAGGVVPVHVTEGRGVRGCYRRPWEATTINPMLHCGRRPWPSSMEISTDLIDSANASRGGSARSTSALTSIVCRAPTKR